MLSFLINKLIINIILVKMRLKKKNIKRFILTKEPTIKFHCHMYKKGVNFKRVSDLNYYLC